MYKIALRSHRAQDAAGVECVGCYRGLRARGAGGRRRRLRLARHHAAHAALHQRLEVHRAGRQVLDADARLPRAHVGERAHGVHCELHLRQSIHRYLAQQVHFTKIVNCIRKKTLEKCNSSQIKLK